MNAIPGISMEEVNVIGESNGDVWSCTAVCGARSKAAFLLQHL